MEAFRISCSIAGETFKHGETLCDDDGECFVCVEGALVSANELIWKNTANIEDPVNLSSI